MKDKTLLFITTLICLLPMLLGALLYSRLPAYIPMHFDAQGAADNYMPKALFCFAMPIGFALLNAVVHISLNNDPKRAAASHLPTLIGKWLIPVMTIFLVPVSLLIALGWSIPIQIVVPALVGIVIMISGNYLPKSRRNYTVGIKLPWTLHSENNWNRTHRLAGVLWIIGGAIMLICAFVQFYTAAVTIVLIVILVAVPVIYSYLLYRQGV